MKRISWPLLFSVLLALLFAVWLTDGVTFEGQRTTYTANCQDGTWNGPACTGQLIAGERFRFRALKAHREVLFWTAGAANEASGKFTNCEIQSGRNWVCEANSDLPRTITREMVHGIPVPDATGKARPFHRVSKLRWHLLYLGIPTGNSVNQDTFQNKR